MGSNSPWFFSKDPRLISQLDHLLELLMHTIHTVQSHDAQANAFAHGFADSATKVAEWGEIQNRSETE